MTLHFFSSFKNLVKGTMTLHFFSSFKNLVASLELANTSSKPMRSTSLNIVSRTSYATPKKHTLAVGSASSGSHRGAHWTSLMKYLTVFFKSLPSEVSLRLTFSQGKADSFKRLYNVSTP